MNATPQETHTDIDAHIAYYRLDRLMCGEHYYYVWRRPPAEETAGERRALLVDLNSIFIPEGEIDKLLDGFELEGSTIRCIAFFNCHIANQREIKRRLKAFDVRLFSKTAFFIDLAQAQKWLARHAVGACP